MKSIKELLEMLLTSYTSDPEFGLCSGVMDLYARKEINSGENYILLKYLRNNCPVTTFYDFEGNVISDDSQFWYPAGVMEPRMQWLEEHIKLND